MAGGAGPGAGKGEAGGAGGGGGGGFGPGAKQVVVGQQDSTHEPDQRCVVRSASLHDATAHMHVDLPGHQFS